ncbi:hypothetical protein [Nocardioides soli]|uniref:Uncharacterized protein n=1 Tax=Nocardioides soli TaxID=1036020 RepID=A0A7W4VTT2_9ACTN|nr:hypothetical protein [Nocardioides soli]MBB3041234.1 hypothetical protein [Nocardioides soli]
MNLSTIRKSLVAAGGSALFAGVAGLAAGMSDGTLTGAETVIAGGLALGAFAAVGRATWRVSNADAE